MSTPNEEISKKQSRKRKQEETPEKKPAKEKKDSIGDKNAQGRQERVRSIERPFLHRVERQYGNQ